MEHLRIKERSVPDLEDSLVLVPAGPIRASAAEEFREYVDTLLDDLTSLIIDFHKVEYIDSSTAGYLLKVHDRLDEKGGTLALAGLPPGVRVVIDSIGLTTFFTVCETVEDALEAIED